MLCVLSSVQGQRAGLVAKLAGHDDFNVTNPDGMQPVVQVLFPEIEKFVELGEMGANIGLLPDVSLQKTRMVGQVIENFGSRESITAKLDF